MSSDISLPDGQPEEHQFIFEIYERPCFRYEGNEFCAKLGEYCNGISISKTTKKSINRSKLNTVLLR